MPQRLRYKELYNSSAAGNGTWMQLDSRYGEQPYRNISVNLVSGDTVLIEATAVDNPGVDKSFLTTLDSSKITTLTTITASGNYSITGPWAFIRAVKTGTAGTAVVEGFI